MKRIILFLLLTSQMMVACNKWLDVNPQSEIKAEKLYSDEAGFRTALGGIYISLGDESAYGATSTFLLSEIFAQTWDNVGQSTAHYYHNAAIYDLKSAYVKSTIQNIWSKDYNIIANINYLLENLENVGPEFFKSDSRYYPFIKAECLGLRAWLHFDMLRLFYREPAKGFNEKSIPYVDKVSKIAFPQLTAQQVMERCINDCLQARELLKSIDPIGPAFDEYKYNERSLEYTFSEGVFFTGREERCNYYAIGALMARIYLWQNNKAKAFDCANEIFKDPKFTQFSPSFEIFHLFCSRLESLSEKYFTPESSAGNVLTMSKEHMDNIYETSVYGSIDQRDNTWFTIYPESTQTHFNKYRQLTPTIPPTFKYIPMMSLSELYYITSECTTDPGLRYARLNAQRNFYGLTTVYDISETDDYETELFKEYQKRFVGEGQLFYFMKRKNFTSFPYTPSGAASPTTVYDLMDYLPESEYLYGNIER